MPQSLSQALLINHFVGGEASQTASGRTGPVWNPATGQQIAEVNFASIEDVDHETNDQPRKKTKPSKNWQAGHQQDAEEHAQHWRDNTAGRAETAMAMRISIPQNNYADRHQDKCKKGSDVREIGKSPDVENPSGDTYYKSSNPSRGCRSSKTGMNTTAQLRQ